MKTQLRRLRLIGGVIDLGRFYCITVYENEINLQGFFRPELVKSLTLLRFVFNVTTSGHLCAKRNHIKITLT